jgi:hypothetical protein
MLPYSQTFMQLLALFNPTSSRVSKRNARHYRAGALSFSSSIFILPPQTLISKAHPALEPTPPGRTTMDFLPSTQIYPAVAVQTLALPCTLILCITSMLRERFIHHQDERRLVRLYKQHACIFELVQISVALMAFGFVAGNTAAAIEARSLVIGLASEDVTSMIVRDAIKRNVWFAISAVGVLACMSMLDSWSLPESMQDLTDPLFRLTRERVRDCKYLRYAGSFCFPPTNDI